VPFEKLVEELHPKRDLSRNPLFQVALAMHNTPQAELRLDGVDVETVIDLSNENAKFDLQFSITEAGGALRTRVEYATDLFDAGTIERMIGHWRVLLSAVAADPTQRISRLPLLTAEEREQLAQWNATAADFPRERCVHELFEQQVERAPAAIAVVSGERQLTYAELNAEANRLAHHLRGLGVGPDRLVGLCLERSVEFVVGVLGILKAGGAYLPLDPTYPLQRLAFMLSDTQASVVLTQERLLGRLPTDATRTLCIDRDAADIARAPTTNPTAGCNAANLAYVVYTSGSTGEPKGVMIEHRSVNRLVCNANYVRWAADDCVAFASNIGFDAATFEIWGALVNGARLAILAKETILDGALLAAAIAQQRITTMFLTTALFNTLARTKSPPFGQLTNLLFGGEACDASAVRSVLERGAPKRLLNVYGPTETTTFATAYEILSVEAATDPIPIGRPIVNTSAYVVDGHGQPQPVGICGELFIGGDGVARGYLNRPDISAERFVDDPSVQGAEARLYKTGDIVRWTTSGDLVFIGRRDHQIKIRGFRIELGEIEATLAQHPAVAKSVVITRQDKAGDLRLVAYVMPRSAPAPTPRSLHDFAAARLPEYMVPAAFVAVDRFPMTPAGKIDRGALAPPDERSTVAADDYAAPRDDLERHLCRIWSQVLDVERVGLDDDFFDLGGNSLLGARLFAQLGEEFGRALPLSILFEAPQVRKLAEYLRSSTLLDGCMSLVAITRASARPPDLRRRRRWRECDRVRRSRARAGT
jgi:amino acid adenylation domain-containing protein